MRLVVPGPERRRQGARSRRHAAAGAWTWGAVKGSGLADDNLLARSGPSDDDRVAPVSPMAASIIIEYLSAYLLEHCKLPVRAPSSRSRAATWCHSGTRAAPTGSDSHDGERSLQLKCQGVAALERARPFRLGSKGFDGTLQPADSDVWGHAERTVLFDCGKPSRSSTAELPRALINGGTDGTGTTGAGATATGASGIGSLSAVVAHASKATLYIPRASDEHFPCDAITVPKRARSKAAAAENPIVLWQFGAVAPQHRDEGELMSILDDVIPQLQAAHPKRRIVLALCWDGELPQADSTRKGEHLSPMCRRLLDRAAVLSMPATGSTVQIVVVDRAGMQSLGVLAGSEWLQRHETDR